MISAVCSPKRHGSATKIGCNTANDMKLMRHHQQLVQLVISDVNQQSYKYKISSIA